MRCGHVQTVASPFSLLIHREKNIGPIMLGPATLSPPHLPLLPTEGYDTSKIFDAFAIATL